MTLLRLTALSKRYSRADRAVYALRDVNLDLNRGEFVAVMGASGSGKTTLLHLIAGLEPPTSGTVAIGESFLHTLSEEALARYRRKTVGYAFQFFNLMPNLNALENVALPLIIARTPRREALAQAEATLALFGMTGQAGAELSTLSGGELQRLALARAVVHHPALLLADEPTASLDGVEADRLLGLLHRLKVESGLSILMVTHSARVAAHADRILTLKEGRLKSLEGAAVFA